MGSESLPELSRYLSMRSIIGGMSLFLVKYQLDNAGSNGETIMLYSLFARCGK
jgi:hypothetical protein